MPPFGCDAGKAATQHDGIEHQPVALRLNRHIRMIRMGVLTHLIEAGTHIHDFATLVYQRNVYRRAAAVV